MFKAVAEVMALGIFVFFCCCLETQTREKAETFSDRLFILPTNYYYQTSLFYLFARFFYLFACLFIYPLMSLQIYFNSAEFNKVKS